MHRDGSDTHETWGGDTFQESTGKPLEEGSNRVYDSEKKLDRI